jgi:hypothetical protein
LTPGGQPNAIQHVIHIVFDNVHFRRDMPNVPSDLEQMPHLLNFIKDNGTLLANEHTPLIAHTAYDIVTGLTGVYGDQSGIPIAANSFNVYNNSPVGSFSTSAFTYWTNTLPKPNIDGTQPLTMIDSSGHNLQAPWVPYVHAGCNVAAISAANMVLENSTTDVAQVFGPNSPEANDPNGFNNYVGIAVHCADLTCSSVGNGSGAHAKPELGGQGFGALYSHKYIASQVSNITETNGTPINGFESFDPAPSWTLGYMLSVLQAGVPVVYGYVATAHNSDNDCNPTTPSSPIVSPATTGPAATACGAFAPGEPGYVQKLQQWDLGFQQFFDKLNALGINKSNTVFVVHSDENDHYAGTPPLNRGCDGVNTPCIYDRTRLGEVTTDVPLLLQQQRLYDFGGSFSRPGFSNTDVPYAIDFDTAPGFWLKGHPANGSPPLRKLEGALAAVRASNPYTGRTENLFRFLVDQPGLAALHMLTSDNNRTPGVVGFGAEDHFNLIFSLISTDSHGNQSSGCNVFPSPTATTCTSNGFIWLHGNFEPDTNNTWAALVGPGVRASGVNRAIWADHTDLRPTLMTLLCLHDDYTHEGRALVEGLDNSALPDSAQDVRGPVAELGRTFKQINAPVGEFGRDAIHVSTAAISSHDPGEYASLEAQLQALVTRRNALASDIEAQLNKIPGCSGFTANAQALDRLNDRGQELLEDMRHLAARHGDEDDSRFEGGD